MTSPFRIALVLSCALAASCATGPKAVKPEEFHTSGDREADQRAEQRMTTAAQVRGDKNAGRGGELKQTLFVRLGGEAGVRRIVDDFVDRAVVDPRVNWTRKGVKSGGVLGVGGKSQERPSAADDTSGVKDHMVQFICVASGGPTRYEGRDLKELHKGMVITNSEFDATIGDLKASLDRLAVPVPEQKELLAVLESTRPQIVEER
jgi:hemoglobin